ncbi:DIP1984 family protein [Nocardioides lijunqiniae]|uniref:DIP1984 family protein n=1 Tax=Nocardioides lijunqiniae TaxID=2760832 RepID=UPI001878F078|nr:DIP1984 family protein [Nocardioides lijunqiniae]
MMVAEALIERADLQKRVEQLRQRIETNARYQEGEEPSEDAATLLRECGDVLVQLRRVVTAINLTNATTTVADGRTLTELLAEREALRARHSVLVAAAAAASGSGHGYRQMRSELRQIAALPVAEVRREADQVARELRVLDVLVQRTNWEAVLVEV